MYAVAARHVAVFISSLLLSYYLVPLVAKTARLLRILDLPDGVIKIHEQPIPYLGGLAVYVAFIMTLGVFYPFNNTVLWLLLGSTILLFVGLIDDLAVLNPGQKFFGQCVAVCCFLKGGLWLKSIFFSSFFTLAFSGFWMLSIINAFNLIDVMDGLSSLVAIITASSFFLMALFFGVYDISLLLLAFIGAMIAFFFYNKPPARIYLGDAGALFVGGFLAAIPLLLPWSSRSFDAYYAAPVIFAVPLLELFYLVVIRTRLGIPFYKGSPHHFSIYLMRKKWKKGSVLCFVGGMNLLLFVGAMNYLVYLFSPSWLAIFCILFFIIWSLIIFLPAKKSDVNSN